MFNHIMLGANDMMASKQFYDALFEVLGYQAGVVLPEGKCFYITSSGVFAISLPIDGQAATRGNGSTIGFKAKSIEEVNQWHATGLMNGGHTCEDPPGLRQLSVGQFYLAYLLDPAGNKICAVYRGGPKPA